MSTDYTPPVATVPTTCTAFQGTQRVASGDLHHVSLIVKEILDADRWASVLIFDDATSETVEIDFRGTPEDVVARLQSDQSNESAAMLASDATPESPSGPGRPKLGVVAREVTLLPRHWDWLNQQSGGASVALRKLVEEARRSGAERDRIRQAQEVAYRFLSTMAGDLAGFESASRALFAGDGPGFDERTELWPVDIRDHARKLAARALPVAG